MKKVLPEPFTNPTDAAVVAMVYTLIRVIIPQFTLGITASTSASLYCARTPAVKGPTQFVRKNERKKRKRKKETGKTITNLIAIVPRTLHATIPAILLRGLCAAAVHAEHIPRLCPNQAVFLALVVTKPATVPPLARRTL